MNMRAFSLHFNVWHSNSNQNSYISQFKVRFSTAMAGYVIIYHQYFRDSFFMYAIYSMIWNRILSTFLKIVFYINNSDLNENFSNNPAKWLKMPLCVSGGLVDV